MFGTIDDERLEPVLGTTVEQSPEAKREPALFFPSPAQAGAHGSIGPGLPHGTSPWAEGPREEQSEALRSPEPLEREPQAARPRWWVRLRGPVGSLILHLLPLLLLIDWPVSPPAQTEPIPVQLVFEPPPKAAPAPPPPVPQPKPTPPPPRGRLASEDLGEPEAKVVDKPKGDPPAADKPAKTETPPAETKPPEKPQQTAALAPPPLPPAKPDAPKPDPVPKPAPKPTPAAHQVPRRVEEPGNLAPRRGRFPGPAATRDEYLAYMHSLIRQHYNLLSSVELGGRRGMTVIEFVVLDDGKIALLKIRRSSGYPDIDNRVAEMITAVGHFPPLPQWFQGLAMPFEFGFPFPEALRE
ncbi:MAG TPA: TonB family protein [Stellaceae bacterium]|nr:TonB family protein [Stellaceae bacterium]